MHPAIGLTKNRKMSTISYIVSLGTNAPNINLSFLVMNLWCRDR